VRPDEIIEQGVERDHVRVIGDLLGMAVRQAREAAHVHPHRLVVSLHKRRVGVLHIGIALDGHLPNPRALGGAVAARWRGRGAVLLDDLRNSPRRRRTHPPRPPDTSGGHPSRVERGSSDASEDHP
jgi:hypothetical protein